MAAGRCGMTKSPDNPSGESFIGCSLVVTLMCSLYSNWICFGHLRCLFRFGMRKRLDRMGLIKMQDSVKLVRQTCVKVMARPLSLGSINHTDGAFQPLSTELCRANLPLPRLPGIPSLNQPLSDLPLGSNKIRVSRATLRLGVQTTHHQRGRSKDPGHFCHRPAGAPQSVRDQDLANLRLPQFPPFRGLVRVRRVRVVPAPRHRRFARNLRTRNQPRGRALAFRRRQSDPLAAEILHRPRGIRPAPQR